MYLIFTRVPCDNRRLRSLLCLCDVFWMVTNSLVCRFCTGVLSFVLFQTVTIPNEVNVSFVLFQTVTVHSEANVSFVLFQTVTIHCEANVSFVLFQMVTIHCEANVNVCINLRRRSGPGSVSA